MRNIDVTCSLKILAEFLRLVTICSGSEEETTLGHGDEDAIEIDVVVVVVSVVIRGVSWSIARKLRSTTRSSTGSSLAGSSLAGSSFAGSSLAGSSSAQSSSSSSSGSRETGVGTGSILSAELSASLSE